MKPEKREIMKKILLLFTMLFMFSSSLISCRENPNEATDADLNNEELEVSDDVSDDTLQVPREEGVGEINE